MRSVCAQHGRDLGGESPPVSWPLRAKRSATAQGRPSVDRKRRAKPRADGQKPDNEARPIRASRHTAAKLFVVKERSRRSGGCAVKDRVLTWGELASRLKGRRPQGRSEKSAEAIVAGYMGTWCSDEDGWPRAARPAIGDDRPRDTRPIIEGDYRRRAAGTPAKGRTRGRAGKR